MNIISNHIEDKYSFESENIKVVFSNPSIQPWDEYGYCKGENDILHFYYRIDGFVKRNDKWENLFKLDTYDFPRILAFAETLKAFIGDINHFDDYQRIDKEKNNYWLIKSYDLGGLCEDYYAVKHELYMEDGTKKHENFEVTIGKPFDIRCSEVQSVSFKGLTQSDLKVVYDCVGGFINYTIQKNNEIVINQNKKRLSSWLIKDGKLYEIAPNRKDIISVYIVGDRIDSAKVLCGNVNLEDFYSIGLNDFVIDEIVEDGIIISSGYEEKPGGQCHKIKEPRKIEISCLLDLFNDVSNEQLAYDEDTIARDFMGVLSQNEKEEFRKKSIDFLYNKWREAIINRTWMCRDEHNLPNRVKDKGKHENVYASVKNIIKELKKRLEIC